MSRYRIIYWLCADTNNQLMSCGTEGHGDFVQAVPEVEHDALVKRPLVQITSITLAVRDPDNARSDATIWCCSSNRSTRSHIYNRRYIHFSNEMVTFKCRFDSEDIPTELSARWTSSLDGELTTVDIPNSSGEITGGNLRRTTRH